MQVTKEYICNRALQALGIGRDLLSDGDLEKIPAATDKQNLLACREFYEPARRVVLRDSPWTHSAKYSTGLRKVAEDPNDEWKYAYEYPSDCLWFNRICSGSKRDTKGTEVKYKIGYGGKIGDDVTITAISTATSGNPGIVTSVAHGLLTGDRIYISGIVGMTQLNDRYYTVQYLTDDTFALVNPNTGLLVSTYGMTTYSSAGTANLVLNQVIFTDEDNSDLTVEYTRYTSEDLGELGTARTITAATAAYAGLLTSTAHGFYTSDRILIESVGGMTALNDLEYIVQKVSDNTFYLRNITTDLLVNTSAYDSYTSGGTAKRVAGFLPDYPEDYIEALGYRLAAFIAPRVVQGDKTNIQGKMWQLYTAISGKAKSSSANEEGQEQEPDSLFVTGR
jgi:hypothetical protein